LPVRELLAVLLGPEGRRRLVLRQKSNQELFDLYDNDLKLRVHSEPNLKGARQLLDKFKDYLHDYPPSPELAKGFLARYVNTKPHTFYNYVGIVKSFMAWYGEELDLKVKIPRQLPPYTKMSDVDKVLAVIKSKHTHKRTIAQDTLLVELDLNSGLRRAELCNLEARDVHPDFVAVRNGKGGKDRIVPLPPTVATCLADYVRGMEPTEKVFKLKSSSLTVKIKKLALKAGITDLHTHSLRHRYAQSLLEAGADVKVVQELMGHSRLDTTAVYLSTTDKRMKEAVALLDKPQPPPVPPTGPGRAMSWELPQYQSVADKKRRELAGTKTR
jgi:site-specific recombinase XerD